MPIRYIDAITMLFAHTPCRRRCHVDEHLRRRHFAGSMPPPSLESATTLFSYDTIRIYIATHTLTAFIDTAIIRFIIASSLLIILDTPQSTLRLLR